jgi:protein O-GlcNAc transferase
MTIPQAFDLALQHHRAGRLAEAEAGYRQILAAHPEHADALHLLGVIAHQVGRHDLAAEWIRQAIVLNPNFPTAHCNLGEALRALGQVDEAMAAYRRAIQIRPDFPEALNNLADALRERGQFEEAIKHCRRALEVKPDFSDAHNNLGAALAGQGKFTEAIVNFRRALELKPNYPEACNNLGAALSAISEHDEAVAACRRALELEPGHARAYNNLGAVLAGRGQFDEAITAYRRALELKPDYAEAHNNLGSALAGHGQTDNAIATWQRALELKSDYPEALNNLGNALKDRGELEEAIATYRRALQLNPDYPEACVNLGAALAGQNRLDEAIVMCRRAIELRPGYPEAFNNLGNALKHRGDLDEAVEAYRCALQVKPEHAWVHSNLIHVLHDHPGYEAGMISEEHERWNQKFSDPLKECVMPYANDRAAGRRLRVGYVSADFREHPVGRYVLPLLERHDREGFEIFCYSGAARPDWMTERLRSLAGNWRSTMGVPDARLAEMVREDGVDILVDLALHTAGNRLPVFARQPAPVQVSWLAYPGSTGLRGIGYRLTDARMEPEGQSVWPPEVPAPLPDCWCCYQPPAESPEVNALPALSAEGVTFGSLNNFSKVNEGVLALWARVLEAVKWSRLLMFCPEGVARDRVGAFFGERGIAAARVEFVGFLSGGEYLRLYQRIDLALDPFPRNGMTTTCDALWMGTPVMTMPGKMPASRAGLSLLSSVGLAELAASSEEDYVRMAVELAGDLPRLAELRASLRTRMLGSPLMDAPRFARNVEAAYRQMWQAWLRKQR